MRLVKSYDEYHDFLIKIKTSYKPTFSNVLWPRDYIERLISQSRLYLESYEGGALFFSDEVLYYELMYVWNVKYPFPSIKLNKPSVIKNTFREGDMPCEMSIMEEQIRKCGYVLRRQLQLVESKNFEPNRIILKLYDYAKKMISKNNLIVTCLTPSMIHDLRSFQLETPTIPYYELQYFSDDELQKQSIERDLIVIANDLTGEIAGYSQTYKMGRYTCGIIAVRDKYLEIGGVTLALSAEAYERDRGRQIHKIGWIGNDNTESIRYHKKMGCTFTNKRMNEWVKEEK